MKSSLQICLTMLSLSTAFAAVVPTFANPPASPAVSQPADPAADRLTFLTLQLSSIEASLHAVNLALRGAGYKAVLTSEKADQAAKGNELMDRNGGAPVAWDKFYGATAKQFEPRDVNGIRHPYDRPSQFDYLYHANNDQITKANSEIASLGQRVDTLLTRRRQLDSEQSALWATISWESLQNRDIPLNPLYRFQLKAKTSTPATDARCDLLRPAILFLRTIDQAVADDLDTLSTNQDRTLTDLTARTQSAYTAAKEPLANAMLSTDLNADDLKTAKELLTSLKHLAELSKNITEAYHLALDGDAANDDNRKLTFRAQLQFALLDYSNAATTLDDQLTKLATTWNLEPEKGVTNHETIPSVAGRIQAPPEPNAPLTTTFVPNPARGHQPDPATPATADNQPQKIDILKIFDISDPLFPNTWTRDHGAIVGGKGPYRISISSFPYAPPKEYDYHIEFTRLDGNESLDLVCFAQGRRFLWKTGAINNTFCGFSLIDGKDVDANPSGKKADQWIVNGKHYSLVIKIRKNSLEATLDNVVISSFKTDYQNITTEPIRGLRSMRPNSIGLIIFKNTFKIDAAEIVEISGHGQLLTDK